MATIEKRVGKHGVTWRVRIRRQQGRSESRSFTRRADADAWARKAESGIDEGEYVPSKHALSEAIDEYLRAYENAPRNKNAREQVRILESWRRELGSRPLRSITSALIVEKRNEISRRKSRYGESLAGGTVNRHLAALSAVMKHAVKELQWLTKNPVSNVSKFSESKGRERFLSEAERDRLLEACDESPHAAVAAVVRLALATGARKGELLSLDWSDVDLDRRMVRFLDTKNSESRAVPLAQPAVIVLREWSKARLRVGRVFPITLGTLDEQWRIARDAAGLPDVRFHDLRHSAASYLAMSGATLIDIAAILGHKTLAMVKRYSHLSEQHTRAAIDRMAAKFLNKSG